MSVSMQNERRPIFLVGLGCGLLANIAGLYWCYSAEALWRPLLLLPPYNIPKFWQAVFTIVVNGKPLHSAFLCFQLHKILFYCFKVRNFYKSALLLTLHFLCRYCCQESCHGTEVWASCILQKQSRAQLSPPGLASITFSVECSLVYCCTNLQNSWDLINEWAVMPVCPCLE